MTSFHGVSPSRRGAFTLLELIVVITIIGLLATMVVVRVVGVRPQANKTKIMSDMNTILRVAEMLYTADGRFPETIEEMVNPKDEQGNPKIAGINEYPKDPWGHDYVYEIVDNQPQVRCLGSDGQEGGTEGETVDTVVPERKEGY